MMWFYFFLMQVIFETSRLATIVNGVLRKTTEDMELNGKFEKIKASFYMYIYIYIFYNLIKAS